MVMVIAMVREPEMERFDFSIFVTLASFGTRQNQKKRKKNTVIPEQIDHGPGVVTRAVAVTVQRAGEDGEDGFEC